MAQMAFAEHHDIIEAFPCGSCRSTVLRRRFAAHLEAQGFGMAHGFG
jgi:hypothetical protein